MGADIWEIALLEAAVGDTLSVISKNGNAFEASGDDVFYKISIQNNDNGDPSLIKFTKYKNKEEALHGGTKSPVGVSLSALPNSSPTEPSANIVSFLFDCKILSVRLDTKTATLFFKIPNAVIRENYLEFARLLKTKVMKLGFNFLSASSGHSSKITIYDSDGDSFVATSVIEASATIEACEWAYSKKSSHNNSSIEHLFKAEEARIEEAKREVKKYFS